jgi:hypothetical protein
MHRKSVVLCVVDLTEVIERLAVAFFGRADCATELLALDARCASAQELEGAGTGILFL